MVSRAIMVYRAIYFVVLLTVVCIINMVQWFGGDVAVVQTNTGRMHDGPVSPKNVYIRSRLAKTIQDPCCMAQVEV